MKYDNTLAEGKQTNKQTSKETQKQTNQTNKQRKTKANNKANKGTTKLKPKTSEQCATSPIPLPHTKTSARRCMNVTLQALRSGEDSHKVCNLFDN